MTHLDQLADKLEEERVRRVIEPLLAGQGQESWSSRDVEYVRDLGLIARDSPVRIANPIYTEVVPRELTDAVQEGLLEQTAWYVREDGSLDLPKLLAAFQEYFRENAEHWPERFSYKEAGPQLLLQAYLQRVVNGGGRLEREYGLGRGRTDLLVLWPDGKGESPDAMRKHVIELKVARGGTRSGEAGPGGLGADRGLHGPLRGGVGALGSVRHASGAQLGGAPLPARRERGREIRHGLGSVSRLRRLGQCSCFKGPGRGSERPWIRGRNPDRVPCRAPRGTPESANRHGRRLP